MSTIARTRAVVGSLYALMRNALGLNVVTPLESQEISCTVAPDRRLVVLGHEPIAGFSCDLGTVADEAAMLALHTLDSTTLLTGPTFVAPGDSCLRTDDPGWRWHCISGHGTALSDWERRPLAGALEGLATIGHTHAISAITGLQTALDSKQAALSNGAALARITAVAGGAPLWDGGSWPASGGAAEDMGVLDWRLRVERAGGALDAAHISAGTDLLDDLRSAGIAAKIVRLDAWLGADLAAALTSLIDRLGAGAVNHGLTSAAYSFATGLTFGGSGYIDSRTTPAMLGIDGNGGLGWWEAVATASGNVECMGSSADGVARYVLDLRSTFESFRWGNAVNGAATTSARRAAHYYGQRASATLRTLYIDGSSVATNTTSDAAGGATVAMSIGASSYASTIYPWTGRSLVSYMTTGTLSDAEIATLHSILDSWLAAIGRS